MRERGQALTLEASIAAVLLIMSLIFALQVSAVTPLTESTSSQHIENQQKEVGQNVLRAAAENGTLKSMILYYDPTEEEYVDAVDAGLGAYPNGVPISTESERVSHFGTVLDDAFSSRGIAYNLDVKHVDNTADGADERRKLKTGREKIVNQGEPSNHAVTVTRTITIYDDDPLYGGGTVETEDGFFISDVSDGPVYNVVEVELIVWRM